MSAAKKPKFKRGHLLMMNHLGRMSITGHQLGDVVLVLGVSDDQRFYKVLTTQGTVMHTSIAFADHCFVHIDETVE